MRYPPAFGACVGMTFIRNDGPPGVLRGLDGLAEAGRLCGVDAVHVRARVGDQVPTSDHLGSELVKIELSAPSHPELRQLATAVRQLISVTDRAGMKADLVLTGGTVFGARPATAVAVRGGRVAWVGHARDVTPMIGSRTQVVRTRGQLVVPGFCDAHVHPVAAACSSCAVT